MTSILTSCSYKPTSPQQLSADELLIRKAKIQQIGIFMILLLVVIAGLAFVLESYLVAATSWAMIPALIEYTKKRKALWKELQNRSLLN